MDKEFDGQERTGMSDVPHRYQNRMRGQDERGSIDSTLNTILAFFIFSTNHTFLVLANLSYIPNTYDEKKNAL